MIATVCIPVAPQHTKISQAAVSSAYAQSIPCDVLVHYDEQCYGAGYARNRMLEKVTTPFVVFLDADDTLEPDFLEQTLRAYRPGHYVYTDWYEDGVPNEAPACDEWIAGKTRMHLVTTLLPMAILRQTRAFDENLPGIEDTDLYMRLRTFGYCGIRVAKPLLHYTDLGIRVKAFRQNSERDVYRETVKKRYEGKIVGCNCNTPVPSSVNGERLEGDVLAEVLYAPMSHVVGGRFYKRPTHTGAQMWVSREHALMRPDLWRIVNDPEAQTPAVDDVIALALAGMQSA